MRLQFPMLGSRSLHFTFCVAVWLVAFLQCAISMIDYILLTCHEALPDVGELLFDLVLTNTEELIKEVKTEGSLDCSDHALVVFVISGNSGLAKSKVRTMNFERANFQLFKYLVDENTWETALRNTGNEKSWQILRALFLQLKNSPSPYVRNRE